MPVGMIVAMGPAIYSTTGVVTEGKHKGVRLCGLTPRVLTDADALDTAIAGLRAQGVDCRRACAGCPIAFP